MPRTTFSATEKSGTSMKCWWTIPTRWASAARGESISTCSPRILISPSSGLQQPEQHVHQRRLAGAVLAEQRVDLAAVQLEVDRVVRGERTEALRHPAHLDDDLPWGVGASAPISGEMTSLT